MTSYIPLFNRRQSILPINDFSGFEDISDTEEDSFSNDQQQSSSAASTTNNTTTTRSREDPLTPPSNLRNQQSSSSSSTSSFTTTTNIIPGGYDFEPQLNESGPSSSSTTSQSNSNRTRSSPITRRNNNNNNAISNSSVTTTNNNNRNQLLSLSERILPSSIYNRIVPTFNSLTTTSDLNREDHGLLFGQEEGIEEEEDDNEDRSNQSTYPPRGTASHIPLPSRPPSFIPSGNGANGGGRIFGGGQSNDGVFANLAAKPEGARRYGGGEFVGGDDAGGDKDEVPPSYEAAALDSTPPYWETTIITPGGNLGPDDICVDGLPVGNFFGFAWNMLVSMSFQFVGFLLTYLLHTTHAAKNGSRAGLGITLIQLGLYVKQRAEHPEYMMDGTPGDATGLEGSIGGSDSAGTLSWWGSSSNDQDLATPTLEVIGSIPTQISTALGMGLESSGFNGNGVGVSATTTTTQSLGNFRGEQVMRMSEGANEYMAFFLVILGSFLLVGGVLNYWRAVRWAKAVRQDMGTAAAAV